MPTNPVVFDANTADHQSITRWLQTGLDGYIKDGVGRWAFRPFESHMGKRDDLAEDLRAIYHSLAAAAQTRWRLAIRDLLATQGPDVSRREATEILIDFAVLVRAHEVLEVLPALVTNGRGEHLVDHVVRAAMALASQTEASRDCLDRIRTSPKFSPDYAGLVLMALCHADPDNWLTHVENLAAPMRILASRLSDESTALRFYANTILETVSLSRVAGSSAKRLSECADSQWLWNEWFKGDQSLLRYEPDTDASARLSLRANEAVSISIDGDLAFWNLENSAQETAPDDAVAIAWAKAPKGRFWTAVYQGGHLAELTRKSHSECIEAQRVFLVTHQDACADLYKSSAEIASWLSLDRHQAEAVMPDFAGIIIRFAERPAVPAIESDLTSWGFPSSNRRTDRVKYLAKYDKDKWAQLQDFLQAIHDQNAFIAAAFAIGLAKKHSVAV